MTCCYRCCLGPAHLYIWQEELLKFSRGKRLLAFRAKAAIKAVEATWQSKEIHIRATHESEQVVTAADFNFSSFLLENL